MGLTIHYKGRIHNYNIVERLVKDVIVYCARHSWEFTVLKNNQINGICIHPPECETAFMTFTSEGSLVSPISVEHQIDPPTDLFVKTEYGTAETHRLLIKLFRQLSEYFERFEVVDESGYWNTADDQILDERFEENKAVSEFYDQYIADDQTTHSLEDFSSKIKKFLAERKLNR